MPPIKFKCPACQAVNEGTEELMGKTLECTGCGELLQVPQAPRKPLMAELLDEPSPTPAAGDGAPVPEGELFFLRPSKKAFLGTMAGVVVMVLAALTLLIYAWQQDFSKLFSLIPLAIALYMGWRVFYRTHSLSYRLTSQRLFIQYGLIGRKTEEIELFRITDVSMEQTPMERLLGIGSILVNSTDETMPVARLEWLSNPGRNKDILRDAYRAARIREGMRAGEFIGSM